MVHVEFSNGSCCFNKIPSTALFRHQKIHLQNEVSYTSGRLLTCNPLLFTELFGAEEAPDNLLYSPATSISATRQRFALLTSTNGSVIVGFVLMKGLFPCTAFLMFLEISILRIINMGRCQCNSVRTSARRSGWWRIFFVCVRFFWFMFFLDGGGGLWNLVQR